MGFDAYYIFASSVAALTARVCTHPIDTIKTRLQVNRTPLVGQGQAYDAIKKVIAQSSLRSLYSGLPVTLLFSVPALSVYLTCYETTKSYLDTSGVVAHDAMMNHLISGCAAEVMAGTLFTPMEVMKNRLQTEQSTQSPKASSLAKTIWRTEGIAGFFRGYWMGLAVFVPHTMTYFAVYEQMKNWWSDTPHTPGAAQLPLGAYLFCSSVASMAGITLSTPLDIIKTRWQVSAGEQGTAFRLGPIEIARHMWQHEGRWRAFTRGLMARIAWGIPTTAISMTVFESLKDWRETL